MGTAHAFLPTGSMVAGAGVGLLPWMILLGATPALAVDECEDEGPWPCEEAGCPARLISCAKLVKNCKSRFDQVWTRPPSGLAAHLVSDHCPATCGKCNPPSLPPSTPPSVPPGESNCVGWRQTGGCTATGKRESASDRSCDVLIEGGWSGYCECSGGVRTAESGCSHETFTCEDKCRERWEWLRQQRRQQQPEEKAEPFDADDSLSKLYKRGKGFYVMGNTELALRHYREALKLDPEHEACKAEYKQASTCAPASMRERGSRRVGGVVRAESAAHGCPRRMPCPRALTGGATCHFRRRS